MNKKKKKNQPAVYEPKPYPKNFGYKFLETKNIEDGIAFIRTLPRKNRRDRKHNLADLAENSTICVCCGRVGTKFCLGQGKHVGQKNRGQDEHWDLYTEDDIALSIDHIHPKSKGGDNHISNYQLMCIECNNFKSNHPERLIPYMGLMQLGIKVVPMMIANMPYLLVGDGEQLPAEIYSTFAEYIREEEANGKYKYFLIDKPFQTETI